MSAEPTPRVAAVAKILVELDLDQLGCAGPKDFYPVQAARIVAALDAYDRSHPDESRVFERRQWECGSCDYGLPMNCTCPDLSTEVLYRVRPETGAE